MVIPCCNYFQLFADLQGTAKDHLSDLQTSGFVFDFDASTTNWQSKKLSLLDTLKFPKHPDASLSVEQYLIDRLLEQEAVKIAQVRKVEIQKNAEAK